MIAIVEYNAGNIRSVQNALQRLGAESRVTDDPVLLRSADKVIFPGVGQAGSAMEHLRQKGLDRLLPELRQPFLGICLGQQLMCAESEEGHTSCLGIFDAKVLRFPEHPLLPVPHMGWNNLHDIDPLCPLFKGLSEQDDVYFVHGYYCQPSPFAAASCTYILPFAAALQKDNFYATQFHPEKSADAGELILKNFLDL